MVCFAVDGLHNTLYFSLIILIKDHFALSNTWSMIMASVFFVSEAVGFLTGNIKSGRC